MGKRKKKSPPPPSATEEQITKWRESIDTGMIVLERYDRKTSWWKAVVQGSICGLSVGDEVLVCRTTKDEIMWARRHGKDLRVLFASRTNAEIMFKLIAPIDSLSVLTLDRAVWEYRLELATKVVLKKAKQNGR